MLPNGVEKNYIHNSTYSRKNIWSPDDEENNTWKPKVVQAQGKRPGWTFCKFLACRLYAVKQPLTEEFASVKDKLWSQAVYHGLSKQLNYCVHGKKLDESKRSKNLVVIIDYNFVSEL